MGSGTVLDPERVAMLKELDGGDGSLLGALAEEYERDAREQLAAMRGALSGSDAATLERSAHTLKGASANLGADAVADACRALEARGRDGNVAGAETEVDEVERLLEDVYAALGRVTAGA